MHWRQAIALLRHLGPGWVAFRVRYALRRRSGGLRRSTPCVGWAEVPAPAEASWSLGGAGVEPGSDAAAVQEAEAVLRGRYRLFSHLDVDAGPSPRWHWNYLAGREVPAEAHWSQLGDFAHGDIKGVWELSRFPWAFRLARAYRVTGDERFAEAYWRLLGDWMGANPPNRGPNWMCGQEAAFRLMAVVVARHALGKNAGPEQLLAYRRLVYATGRRIRANLDYALSQRNNHGISEAVGLVTAALVLPEALESASWESRGLAALREQLGELVYPDGGFAQHSLVYHRVLLHDLLWLEAVLRAAGRASPEWLQAAGGRAAALLGALVDPATGAAPLYGSNDGADVLPLAPGEFGDFRPVVQAAHAVFRGVRLFPPGPWDGLLRWLAPWAAAAPVQPRVAAKAEHFPQAGCLQLVQGRTRIFLRCPERFRHRPAQADLLHVDLSWRGLPVAIDAGTFSYNAPGQFAGALKEAAVHSTVTFGGAEPLQKAGRFLYLPWPVGQFRVEGERYSASHNGWRRLGFSHWRTVEPWGTEGFAVEDELQAEQSTTARLHWLLGDYPHELAADRRSLLLQTPAGGFRISWEGPPAEVSVVRADPASSRGWWSPAYYRALPALSLALGFPVRGKTRMVTRLAPA